MELFLKFKDIEVVIKKTESTQLFEPMFPFEIQVDDGYDNSAYFGINKNELQEFRGALDFLLAQDAR